MQFAETIRVNTTSKCNRIISSIDDRVIEMNHVKCIKPSGKWGWEWLITYYPVRPKFYIIVFENDSDKKVHNRKFAKRKDAFSLAKRCMEHPKYNYFSKFTVKIVFPIKHKGVEQK